MSISTPHTSAPKRTHQCDVATSHGAQTRTFVGADDRAGQ
jgi:hypothetical protein